MRLRACLAMVAAAWSLGTGRPVMAEEIAGLTGSMVERQLSFGEGQAHMMIPLPKGEWRVIRADEGETRMLNPINQHMAQKRLDIFLAQRAGSRLAMTMRIEGPKNTRPNSITYTQLDDPCKRTDTLHRNAYDSGGSVVNCLLVNHLTGYMRAPTGFYADFRDWLEKEKIETPKTVLAATFTQNLPSRFLIVTITVNPALRGLDSDEGNWTASPFNRRRIGADAARTAYVKEFVAWSEAYMPLISLTRPTPGGGRPVPSFP
jgi:hypothetical protein